jgi:hypothetical protein
MSVFVVACGQLYAAETTANPRDPNKCICLAIQAGV